MKPRTWSADSVRNEARRHSGIELQDDRAEELAEELEVITSRLRDIRGQLDIDDPPWLFARLAHGRGHGE